MKKHTSYKLLYLHVTMLLFASSEWKPWAQAIHTRHTTKSILRLPTESIGWIMSKKTLTYPAFQKQHIHLFHMRGGEGGEEKDQENESNSSEEDTEDDPQQQSLLSTEETDEESSEDYNEEYSSSDQEEDEEDESEVSSNAMEKQSKQQQKQRPYDEMLALTPMQDMGISLGVMILCNRLDLNNSKIIRFAR